LWDADTLNPSLDPFHNIPPPFGTLFWLKKNDFQGNARKAENRYDVELLIEI
jgi:hypothetical protein